MAHGFKWLWRLLGCFIILLTNVENHGKETIFLSESNCRRLHKAIVGDGASRPPVTTNTSPAKPSFNIPHLKKKVLIFLQVQILPRN
jgi:hypothetical protein